jgi:hypothetical protein
MTRKSAENVEVNKGVNVVSCGMGCEPHADKFIVGGRVLKKALNTGLQSGFEFVGVCIRRTHEEKPKS